MVGPIATLRLMQLCHPYLEQGRRLDHSWPVPRPADMSNYGVYAAEKDAIRALTRGGERGDQPTSALTAYRPLNLSALETRTERNLRKRRHLYAPYRWGASVTAKRTLANSSQFCAARNRPISAARVLPWTAGRRIWLMSGAM